MRILFFCSTLLLLHSAQAQPDPIGNFNKHVIEQWTEQYLQISQYRVKGSPFLLGEAFEGQVMMKSGIKTNGQKVLYNLYEQKAGLELKKERELVAPDGEIESFWVQLPERFGAERLLFVPVTAYPEVKQKGYFNVAVDGPKAALLRYYRTRLIPDPGNLYSKEIRMFEQYTEYFIYNKTTKQMMKVRIREKDIREALGNPTLPGTLEFDTWSGLKRAVEEANKL